MFVTANQNADVPPFLKFRVTERMFDERSAQLRLQRQLDCGRDLDVNCVGRVRIYQSLKIKSIGSSVIAICQRTWSDVCIYKRTC